MASPVPAKSQPLYSFSLPQWKLTKNHTNNHHRGRRGGDSSSSSSQQLPPLDTAPRRSPGRRHSPLKHVVHRQSPMRESASESESSQAVLGKRKNSLPPPQAHSGKNGYIVSSSSLDHTTVKADKQPAEVSDHDKDEGKESRSKIYIRLKTPSKNNKPCEGQDEGNLDIEGGGAEVEESMSAKTWNLRPRKPIRKQTNTNGGANPSSSVGKSSPENKVLPKRSEMRSAPQSAEGIVKEKKQKFSISLSRDEIEEDIYAMIGSKPNRRPKKRSKIVQRQLDSVFPGLWLSSITPDVYKVSEIPLKG